MRNSSLKRSDMAHVNEGSHSFNCHPHVYPQVEWTMPAFTPQPQSVTALWPVLIFRPLRVEGWVGLSYMNVTVHYSRKHQRNFTMCWTTYCQEFQTTFICLIYGTTHYCRWQ